MATTPTHDWPTPDNVDRVADGASAIRALGDAIDADVPLFYTYSGSVGSLVATAAGTLAVTFPASYFTATPTVIGTALTGSSAVVTITNLTAAGCTVVVKNIMTSTTISGNFNIVAIQT